jgi:HEAT repeat protein
LTIAPAKEENSDVFGNYSYAFVLAVVWPACTAWADAAVDARVHELSNRLEVQWNRVDTAGPVQSSPTPQALPVLRETAQSENDETRLRGFEGLAANPNENIDLFLGALTDPSPEVRELAARTLNAINSPRVFDMVMSILCQANPDAVADLDPVLPLLRDSIEKRLIDLLRSTTEPPNRKMSAAYALGKMKSTAAVADIAALAESQDTTLALYCLNALVMIPDALVLQSLAKLAGAPNPQIRWYAVRGIGAVTGPDAAAALGRIAIEPPSGDPALSREAIDQLAARKEQSAVPLLIDIVRRNADARRAAVNALRRLTGEDFDDNADEWQRWYEDKKAEAAPKSEAAKELYDMEYMPEE